MSSELTRVQNAIDNVRHSNATGETARWNPRTKRIEVVDQSDPDGDTLQITPEDMRHFAGTRG